MPNSSEGIPARSSNWLYPQTMSMISRASTQARLTANPGSPCRSSSARIIASPSRNTFVAPYLASSLLTGS